MISKVYSASCVGISAHPIEIEVDAGVGLPQMTIVGLPDQSVRESKERVRAALKNSHFDLTPEKITVNLAPAHIKKEGPAFDLGIALGILSARGYIKTDKMDHTIFVGELALDGSLRPIKGALSIAQLARRMKAKLLVPHKNENEVALEPDVSAFSARNLYEVVSWINGEQDLPKVQFKSQSDPFTAHHPNSCDFSEIKGQYHAKRAAEIAASGKHNLLLIGPPGGGKTMLAKRIPTILPPLSRHEYIDVIKIYSAAGLLPPSATAHHYERPFRAPHHTVSQIALVGGGSFPKPGEISLAHNGILFLDEFPEFRRDAIESLRAPIEDGLILISRARENITLPTQFLLIAAMNPCPCGFLTSPKKACRCTLQQIQRYHQKISGPILDRIDLHVEMAAIEYSDLSSHVQQESSEAIRHRVLAARHLQRKRFPNSPDKSNADMNAKDLKLHCVLSSNGKKLLEQAMKSFQLSARGYYKILKISRTIADLTESETIEETHVAEAIQLRTLDRNLFTS